MIRVISRGTRATCGPPVAGCGGRAPLVAPLARTARLLAAASAGGEGGGGGGGGGGLESRRDTPRGRAYALTFVSSLPKKTLQLTA